METLTLRPSEIRYSQDSIGCRFSDGTPLTCVFAHLVSGSLNVTDLPEIEVVQMDGHWWARTGNRRLFLYRKLEGVGVVETIDVIRSWINPTSDSFQRKFTTACDGLEIVCRQDFLESSLDEIVSDWRRGEEYLVAKWDRSNRALAEQYGYREDSETDQSDDDNDECSQDEDDQSEADQSEADQDEDDQSDDDQDEDDQDEDDQDEDDQDEDDNDEDENEDEEGDQSQDDHDEDDQDEDDQDEDDQDEDDQDEDDNSDEDEDDQDN